MVSDGSQLFLVTGNSGSGKDSVMSGAARLCPNLCVMTRYITRPAHFSESFVSVSEEEFQRLCSDDFFCMHWNSYGLYYGVPSEIDSVLKQGIPVLVNISRRVIDGFRKKYPAAKLVFIRADIETIRSRIESRGREGFGSDAARQRLARAGNNLECNEADFVIDNSGRLEDSALELCRYISSV